MHRPATLLGLSLALMICICGTVSAQNLVPNPSFESNSGIPTGLGQINLAIPWTCPTNSTPDYFHALAPGSTTVSVSANNFGIQQPATGQAYVGFHARPTTLYREYVETPLSSPLVAGQTYQVSFYVSLADQCQWAIDKIGAYLSVGPVGPFTTAYTLPLSPQINNPSGSYIANKAGWTLVTGLYLASGGEDHLVIGNFFDNPSTTPLTGLTGVSTFSYYYLDDISVTLACVKPPSDMVGWWSLDETIGTAVFEQPGAGGNTDTGTAVPGPIGAGGAAPVSGKVQGGLFFPQPSIYVTVPDSNDLDRVFAIGDFTIDAWIRDLPGHANVVRPIVDKLRFSSFNPALQTGAGTGYAFYVQDNVLKLALGNGSALIVLASSPSSPLPPLNSAWHHVAVAVRRTATAAMATFYFDGIPVGPPITHAFSLSIDHAGPLRIGANPFTPQYFGYIETALDEIEIFKRMLSSAEILSIFNAGSAGKCKADTADLGDAPDSTNHGGIPLPTYAVANFPTVYNPSTSGPSGPLHRNARGFAWLGPVVTLEGEADLGWDQDPLNNLTVTPPAANLDLADDGVTSVPLPDCAMTQFPFSATNALSTPVQAYINVWFDWIRDGDWDDLAKCAVAPNVDALVMEWAVQNHAVTLAPGFNTGLMTPPFRSVNPATGKPVWMRITLTDVPINATSHGGPFSNAADLGKGGSGPVGGYPFGETEDYLWDLKSGRAEICVLKFRDNNGNGQQDPGEPGLANWTIDITDVTGNVVATLTTYPIGARCASVPAPAQYTVSEAPRAGWMQTYPAQGTHTVTVSPGQPVSLSFGNKRTHFWDLLLGLAVFRHRRSR